MGLVRPDAGVISVLGHRPGAPGALSRIGAMIAGDMEELGDEPPAGEARAQRAMPKGFGTMSARLPGTSDVLSGVRLASPPAHVLTHDRLAPPAVALAFHHPSAR